MSARSKTMTQNVKYDVTTGKVYEELGCPSNNNQNDSSKGNNYISIFAKNLIFDEINSFQGVKQSNGDPPKDVLMHDAQPTCTGSFMPYPTYSNQLNYYTQSMEQQQQSFTGSSCLEGGGYNPTDHHDYNTFDR